MDAVFEIRNRFTEELQHKNFAGRDYAEITRAMKRWLGLPEDLNKWETKSDWLKIANAEEKATKLMKKIRIRSKKVAKLICFASCRI